MYDNRTLKIGNLLSHRYQKHVKGTVKKFTEDLVRIYLNSGEVLDKLKARDFNATSSSTYDFSALYTTLPNKLINDKLIDLIERTFQRKGSRYLNVMRNAFFLLQIS